MSAEAEPYALNVQPWSTLAPAGATLHVAQSHDVPSVAVAWVEPKHPPCLDEHEMGWTGIGFPRHPSAVMLVCVRCWEVTTTVVRE